MFHFQFQSGFTALTHARVSVKPAVGATILPPELAVGACRLVLEENGQSLIGRHLFMVRCFTDGQSKYGCS
jgi:hypothetical protein